MKNAERVRKHRERKKQQALEDKNSGNVTCNVTVTDCNGTDKDIDKEIDIDKDKRIGQKHLVNILTNIYVLLKS